MRSAINHRDYSTSTATHRIAQDTGMKEIMIMLEAPDRMMHSHVGSMATVLSQLEKPFPSLPVRRTQGSALPEGLLFDGEGTNSGIYRGNQTVGRPFRLQSRYRPEPIRTQSGERRNSSAKIPHPLRVMTDWLHSSHDTETRSRTGNGSFHICHKGTTRRHTVPTTSME